MFLLNLKPSIYHHLYTTSPSQSYVKLPILPWVAGEASDDFALGVRSDREAYLRAADEAAMGLP